MLFNIRIFIMCEHQGTRRGLAAIFVTEAGFEITGKAGCDSKSVEEVQKIQPDAILFEKKSGEKSAEMIRLIKESCPYSKIFVFADNETDEEARAAIVLGIDGFLAKTMLPCHLVKVVELTCRTGIICLPGSLKRLVSNWKDTPGPTLLSNNNGRSNGKTKCKLPLTARELEIYELITQNCSNKEIGKKLYISQPTVKSHVSNILRKMGFSNRTELLLYEIQNKGASSTLDTEKKTGIELNGTI